MMFDLTFLRDSPLLITASLMTLIYSCLVQKERKAHAMRENVLAHVCVYRDLAKKYTYQLSHPSNVRVYPNSRYLAVMYRRTTFPAPSAEDTHSLDTI